MASQFEMRGFGRQLLADNPLARHSGAPRSDEPGTYEHGLFRQAIDARDQLVTVGVHGFRASSSGRSRNDELDSAK
jgi:hypothetical protein